MPRLLSRDFFSESVPSSLIELDISVVAHLFPLRIMSAFHSLSSRLSRAVSNFATEDASKTAALPSTPDTESDQERDKDDKSNGQASCKACSVVGCGWGLRHVGRWKVILPTQKGRYSSEKLFGCWAYMNSS